MSFLNRYRQNRYDDQVKPMIATRRDSYTRPFSLYQQQAGTFGSLSVSDGALLEASLNEPVAHRLVYKVARDTMASGFDVVTDEGKIHNFNTTIQTNFEKTNLYQAGTYAYELDRLYGRSWLVRLDPSKQKEMKGEDVIYTAFSNPNLASTTSSTWDEYRNFQPVEFNLKFTEKGTNIKVKVEPEDYHFLLTRPYNSEDVGVPILQPCWNDIVALRVMRSSFTERTRKYAGFPHIRVLGANDYVLQKAQEKWGDFDELKEAWSNEETEIDMKGLEGVSLDPQKYLDPYIQQVAIATAYPLPILKGMESGMLKSGQINLASYYSLLTINQEALKLMGEQMAKWEHPTISNFNVRFRLEYAVSDIDRLSMRKIEIENAVALRPYVTDEAFAEMLQLEPTDIENRAEKMFGQGGSPFGGDPNQQPFGKKPDPGEGKQPSEDETGRKFGEKKDKNLRSER